MFFNSTAQHKALLGETSFEMFSLLPFHGAQKKGISLGSLMFVYLIWAALISERKEERFE